jgi:hypothetical protein
MAEAKDSKVTKVDVKAIPADREGLLSSIVTQSADLAERTTGAAFGMVRDVRVELNQRVLGTLAWIESSQQGVFKLLRSFNERTDKLAEETLETVESLALGVIRAVRDTGRGVTDLAISIGKPREVSRAA